METFAVVIFTVEYTVRLLTCPSKKAFLFTPLYIVDLLAIIPCARAPDHPPARSPTLRVPVRAS